MQPSLNPERFYEIGSARIEYDFHVAALTIQIAHRRFQQLVYKRRVIMPICDLSRYAIAKQKA